jgi:hypothetical protein
LLVGCVDVEGGGEVVRDALRNSSIFGIAVLSALGFCNRFALLAADHIPVYNVCLFRVAKGLNIECRYLMTSSKDFSLSSVIYLL